MRMVRMQVCTLKSILGHCYATVLLDGGIAR